MIFEDFNFESNARIEWNQYKNGPRHTGLYAQPYEGDMPEGITWWRVRVIITDDLDVWQGHVIKTSNGIQAVAGGGM